MAGLAAFSGLALRSGSGSSVLRNTALVHHTPNEYFKYNTTTTDAGNCIRMLVWTHKTHNGYCVYDGNAEWH